MAINPLNPFEDLTKLMEQFKLPGVDMTAFVEARRKDVAALTEANKVAYESMQALAAKQTEMLTQAMQGIQEAAKAAATGSGMVDPAKQAEAAQAAYKKALADMQELAEIARKSQTEAMASITQRASEHMQEFKKMMQPK
jgi:phasin family protein